MTDILVSVETVLLVVTGLLVAGMLRTHADIMRALNLGPADASQAATTDAELPAPPASVDERLSAPAAPLEGVNLDLDLMSFEMHGEGGTLLGFLSSGCLACLRLWDELSSPSNRLALPAKGRFIVVVKDPVEESLAKLRELAPAIHPVVMSSQAWSDYNVPGAPYFVWIDGATATIRGVGASDRIEGVLKLLSDHLAEENLPEARAEEERQLRSAGIYPGHPSLYGLPTGDNDRQEVLGQ
jgi:hypothetical protein